MKNGIPLRFLQKIFPVIKRSQFKNRSIYYLEDKNKLALREMMKLDSSRIISYQELSKMTQVFNTDIEINHKRSFIGRNWERRGYKVKSRKQRHKSFSKEKQTRLDDFLGRFLHSEVLMLSVVTLSPFPKPKSTNTHCIKKIRRKKKGRFAGYTFSRCRSSGNICG